ncbi:MAG: SUMF1/EgtB/PvdO family nonheme iron enzyme [Deltaproteobacteria bacterium]|nr:SUMF1/EgtB/PvdO family nonheme iron enzyme [Deltaproteobacteria bacterium]
MSLSVVVIVGCGGAGAMAPLDGVDTGTDPDAGSMAPDAAEAGATLSHCPAEPDVHGAISAHVRWSAGIAFCIDGTEVTNAAYATFLAATVATGTQGPRCAWNKTFVPETISTNGPTCPVFDAKGRPNDPVVCIDWCDADAYCRWAGKHLCQTPGGGIVKAITAKNASEWVIACTGDGAGKYPYGNTPTVGRCVDRQFPAPTPGLRPVKEANMCEGGVAGLFDMSGNAWEWHDDCVEKAGAGGEDTCTVIGGSFSSELATATCTDTAPFFRKQVAGDTGFRCCADADFF